MAAKHTNRLAREKSPYLLQHRHNPVDWFPWGEAAFARARAGHKPVFLSIGYSTCHWCHVMERESFEDEKIGAFLNEHFVSIKVDREERPDVDKIYMTFVQATTGGGGWPMSVFLTPDLKPFFGGTYFPPESRFGRPSFLQLLQHVAAFWRDRGGDLVKSANEIHARLAVAAGDSGAPNVLLSTEVLRQAAGIFKASYDPRHGGFGGAPKFPQPATPAFLLRHARRFHDAEAARMVLHTCGRMAAGGIHDQLGGGFARYAVDAQWLVPHFEKMLYDNAQLAQLYLDAYLVAGEKWVDANSNPPTLQHSASSFAAVARGILDYVLRDLTHPDGGFYSAEDADSEGQEGKFYCWTRDELAGLLTPEEFNVAVRYFGITEQGNFVDHSHPHPLPNLNVLSVVEPLTPPSATLPMNPARADLPVGLGRAAAPAVPSPGGEGQGEGGRKKPSPTSVLLQVHKQVAVDAALLASAKQKMFAARSRRVRPQLDDKVLASWNGLMLGAMARAGAVLGEEKYLAAAEKNLAFIREKLWESGTGGTPVLYHRWRDGEHDEVELLTGYAFLLSGVIELYEVTVKPAHLEFAIELAEAMVAKFHDVENGGFWQSAAGAHDLILRMKDDHDGAEPSGSSVATLALLKLAAITGREGFRKPAEATLHRYAPRLQDMPQAMPFLLHALDFWLDEPRRIVVAGEPGSLKMRALLLAAHSVYQPNKIILGNTGPVEPFTRTLAPQGGATVFLCTGNSCRPPVQDEAAVRELLKYPG
ncbi:MAG: thioredoxin domain-containing protein [Verrucomicrobiota bacterium]